MKLTTFKFLYKLEGSISKKYVQKLIQSHPDYSSLLSISDVFQQLDIEHIVHRIDPLNLVDQSYPNLLPLNQGKVDLLLIKNEKDLEKYNDALQLQGHSLAEMQDAHLVK